MKGYNFFIKKPGLNRVASLSNYSPQIVSLENYRVKTRPVAPPKRPMR